MAGGDEGGDFVFPVFAHPPNTGVVPDEVVNVDGALVDLHFEAVGLVPEFGYALAIDVYLESACDAVRYLC